MVVPARKPPGLATSRRTKLKRGNRRILGPQKGFQVKVLESQADITIAGGAAGCGKTYVEILAGARHMMVPEFSCVFFRRLTPQITNPGGLWDEALKVYPLLGAKPHGTSLTWTWPSGAKVKMAHLERDTSVLTWQGSQIALIIFDELTHFSASQFWYMLSRNRSTSGVQPYILASCNPDADSWVADLIEWWIDQDPESPRYGLPILERGGKLRYFARINDQLIWGDSREELYENADVKALIEDVKRGMEEEGEDGLTFDQVGKIVVRSLTFIPGKLDENKILQRKDPGYRGKLLAMTRVERERLLNGNWKARAAAGDYFKRSEARMIEEAPPIGTDPHELSPLLVRRWDLAATEPSEANSNPDWTYGILMGRRNNGRFVIIHGTGVRKRSNDVRQLIKRTAELDNETYGSVVIGLPQDPGQAGVEQSNSYVNDLAGYEVYTDRETGSKETRANVFASQWQHGNVDVVRGPWNSLFFSQMEAFPTKGVHDDAVDATTGAAARLSVGLSMEDVL